MSVNKFTDSPTQLETIQKINEIIDNLGGGGGIVDQTYDPTSTNAQSGVAIASAGFTTNIGTVTSVNNVSPVNGNVTLSIPTVPTALSSFTDDLGSSPTHTHSQYELIAQDMTALSASGSISLSDNTINKITATGAVTFTLPTITDLTKFHQIFVQLNMSTAQTINLGTTYYFNSVSPDLSVAGTYNLYFEYDNTASHWVVGCISKGAV